MRGNSCCRMWPSASMVGLRCAALLLLATPSFAQPPAITPHSLVNAASHMPEVLGGGAIARGSRFLIEGVRFGPVGSTRVAVSDGSRTLAAALISVDATRIEAVMPPYAPLGNARITVSRGAVLSEAYPLRVVASSFGGYTRNGAGWGPGLIDNLGPDGSRTPNSPDHPARPGQTIALQGTGWGEGGRPVVLAGGRVVQTIHASAAKVDAPGMDEIVFNLPRDIHLGCFVPIVVAASDTIVSNSVTVAVSANGSPCGEEAPWPVPDIAHAKRIGVNLLVRGVIQVWTGEMISLTDDEGASAWIAGDAVHRRVPPLAMPPPPGLCASYATMYYPNPDARSIAVKLSHGLSRDRGLDAGPAISIQGSRESSLLNPLRGTKGFYGGTIGGDSPEFSFRRLPLFLSPGLIRIAGSGGADAGAFTVSLRVPRPFSWTNRNAINTVDRARGLHLEWKHVQRDRTVVVTVVNIADTGATGVCFCRAAAGAASVDVPPMMLANIPPLNVNSVPPASFVIVADLPQTSEIFQADGIDLGFALYSLAYARSVVVR